MSPTGPRLPYLDDATLAASAEHFETAERIRARRRGGALLNLDRVLLHSPAFAAGWNALLGTVRQKLALDARLRELAICAVACLNAAPYEWLQHLGEWQAAGATPEQCAALAGPIEGWATDPAFDARERLVLALSRSVSREITVPDALMAEVRASFGDRGAVELVGVIAAYNMVSRFLVALGVSADGEPASVPR